MPEYNSKNRVLQQKDLFTRQVFLFKRITYLKLPHDLSILVSYIRPIVDRSLNNNYNDLTNTMADTLESSPGIPRRRVIQTVLFGALRALSWGTTGATVEAGTHTIANTAARIILPPVWTVTQAPYVEAVRYDLSLLAEASKGLSLPELFLNSNNGRPKLGSLTLVQAITLFKSLEKIDSIGMRGSYLAGIAPMEGVFPEFRVLDAVARAALMAESQRVRFQDSAKGVVISRSAGETARRILEAKMPPALLIAVQPLEFSGDKVESGRVETVKLFVVPEPGLFETGDRKVKDRAGTIDASLITNDSILLLSGRLIVRYLENSQNTTSVQRSKKLATEPLMEITRMPETPEIDYLQLPCSPYQIELNYKGIKSETI